MSDTTLNINPDEITGVLRRHLEGFRPEVEKQQVGRIVEVGDGIARISGLPTTAVNELLEFEGGVLGLALNLDEESIGAVVLGDIEHIEEGQAARATGRILSVPVGDGLLGRVVNPLGEPVDGRGPIPSDTTRRLEVQAPGIVARQPVTEPLQTGIKCIDAMTPVGRGQRELIIVYDDLSKQAEAYRQLSLLLRRPPGREAYPGDVFYLHSRLLERAAKLSDDHGGGSLTALPIIETKEGDVSAYIPTNVISITDGQIYLQTDLFRSGVRPAIDVGISVSRVGGSAQIKAMKAVAGTLKLDLAQFRELESFASFGSELDKVSQAQLDRGYRLTELLKQALRSPMPVEEQVISIFAGTRGFIDDIPTGDVRRFEAELLEEFRSRHRELLDNIKNEGSLPDEDTITEAIKAFKERFSPSEDAEDKREEEDTEEQEEARAEDQAETQAQEEGEGEEPPGGAAAEADAPAPG